MVISARREKGGVPAKALGEGKARGVTPESERSLEIRHLEVYVTDTDAGRNGGRWAHGAR